MAITSTALKFRKAALENYYNEMNHDMMRADKLYHRKFRGEISLPENIKIFESSRATGAVDDLRDQIRSDEPTVEAKTFGTSKAAKLLQSTHKMWATGIFTGLQKEMLVDPLAQAPFDLLLRGAACLKVLIKPEVLKGRPVQKQGEMRGAFQKRQKAWQNEKAELFPYKITAIDPLRVFPSPGDGDLKYCVEVQKRRVLDMWESYPGWTDPKAKRLRKSEKENPLREVEWVEYWSWGYDPERDQYTGDYVIEVDGERIIDQTNPYGIVPYIWRYSGLGRVDVDANPSAMAVSVLTPLIGELEQEILMKTALSAAWQYHVFPRLKVKGMSAPDAAAKMQKGPGAVIEIPPQGEAEWMDTPPPNETMLQFLSMIDSAISNRISPALGGQKSADFGIHQALLLGQALKILTPVKAAFNSMGSQLLDYLARLTERFDLSMNVHGSISQGERSRMVTGSDFKKFEFLVKFEAIDPAENDRRMLAGLAVKREGLSMSRETFRNIFMGGIIESNEEEETRVFAEALADQYLQSGMALQAFMAELQVRTQQENTKSAIANVDTTGGAGTPPPGQGQRNIEQTAGGQSNLGEQRALANTALSSGVGELVQ